MLVLAAAGFSWLHLRRMRSAAALLGRLAEGSPATGTGPEPVPPLKLPTGERRFEAPVVAARWSGRLRLAAVFRETSTVKTFRLVNPAGGEIPFVLLLGQFVTLEASVAGKALKRSYTIAPVPTRRAYIELMIKREDQGAVSCHLHDILKVGDELPISGPRRRLPAIRLQEPGGIRLRRRDPLPSTAPPHLQVLACLTQVEGAALAGPRGRFTKAQIAEMVPDIVRRRIHLCGRPAMMEAMKAIVSELGVPPEQLKTEAFGPAISPAIRVPAGATAIADAQQRLTKTAIVSFSKAGKSAPLPPDATIL